MSSLARRLPNHDSVFNRVGIAQVYEFCTGLSASTHVRGNKALVSCPAGDHADKHPSCYLLFDTNTWYCFSCPNAFRDLRGRRSRTMADLVILNGKAKNVAEAAAFIETFVGKNLSLALKPQRRPKAGQGMGKFEPLKNERLVDTYYYQDEDGKTLYRVLRYEGDLPDDNTSMKLAGKGHDKRFVMVGKHDRRRVLFNLPGVLEAAAAHRSVIVVEGESKAKWLNTLGLVATTWANGTNSLFELSWLRCFDGVPYVFLLADADQPGRLKMRDLADKLAAPGRSVVLIDLYPDRTNGNDILDWARQREILNVAPVIAARVVRKMLGNYAQVRKELDTISSHRYDHLPSDVT